MNVERPSQDGLFCWDVAWRVVDVLVHHGAYSPSFFARYLR
jgi:hypothetical protein